MNTSRMEIEYLDDITEIGDAFIKRFVLSWDDFQIKHKDWIGKMSMQNYPIDRQWYDQAYMWDRMDPANPDVSMKDALDYLRKHSGTVYFMTEKGAKEYFQGTKTIDFIAKTDAHQLADRIEYEWYETYRLVSQNRYIPNVLPWDLYVFDLTMKWCVVFTHETTDGDAEKADDWTKTAQSRYCIICEDKKDGT